MVSSQKIMNSMILSILMDINLRLYLKIIYKKLILVQKNAEIVIDYALKTQIIKETVTVKLVMFVS
jgi:hypothetical protein